MPAGPRPTVPLLDASDEPDLLPPPALPAAVEFIDAVVPLARFLARADDDARLALGCTAGRHRSRIVVEELARRLRADGLDVAVHHREHEFARSAEDGA